MNSLNKGQPFHRNVSYLPDLNVISGSPKMTKLAPFSIYYFALLYFFCLLQFFFSFRFLYFFHFIYLLIPIFVHFWPLQLSTFEPLSLYTRSPSFLHSGTCHHISLISYFCIYWTLPFHVFRRYYCM